ncbi:hypothetical protein [Amycolatopsis balhimycina]|uniref:hypothetical protein n=1 Tax=Amycolatopsis balhimycina TaxID=208443 RepID=UPI001FDEF93F|nr:hypothetical protein [Amycolatopsis balhimycina]
MLVVEFTRLDPAAVALGRFLRDEGLEVIHAGPLGTVEQILRTAEQEDPDAVVVLGDEPPDLPGLRVFTDPEEAAEWASGGRSHTGDAPSDRVR